MAEEFVQRAVEQQGEAARCLGPTTRTGQGCVGCDEAEGDEEAEALSLNVEGDLGGAGWNGGGKKRTMKRKRPLEWDVVDGYPFPVKMRNEP
jgi:hypothetical protein